MNEGEWRAGKGRKRGGSRKRKDRKTIRYRYLRYLSLRYRGTLPYRICVRHATHNFPQALRTTNNSITEGPDPPASLQVDYGGDKVW